MLQKVKSFVKRYYNQISKKCKVKKEVEKREV